MDQTMSHTQPAFFILKVWEERPGEARIVWRGELLDVSAGTAQRFTDWPELVDIVAATLYDLRPQLCDAAQGVNQGKSPAK